MEDEIFELKARILKVLPRLKILECLRGGEKSSHEIVPGILAGQSNVSRHISLLQNSHLVTTRKERVKVMVKIRDQKVFEILDSINFLLKKQITETRKLIQELR